MHAAAAIDAVLPRCENDGESSEYLEGDELLPLFSLPHCPEGRVSMIADVVALYVFAYSIDSPSHGREVRGVGLLLSRSAARNGPTANDFGELNPFPPLARIDSGDRHMLCMSVMDTTGRGLIVPSDPSDTGDILSVGLCDARNLPTGLCGSGVLFVSAGLCDTGTITLGLCGAG